MKNRICLLLAVCLLALAGCRRAAAFAEQALDVAA